MYSIWLVTVTQVSTVNKVTNLGAGPLIVKSFWLRLKESPCLGSDDHITEWPWETLFLVSLTCLVYHMSGNLKDETKHSLPRAEGVFPSVADFASVSISAIHYYFVQ